MLYESIQTLDEQWREKAFWNDCDLQAISMGKLNSKFIYLNLLIFGGIINWTLAIFIQR